MSMSLHNIKFININTSVSEYFTSHFIYGEHSFTKYPTIFITVFLSFIKFTFLSKFRINKTPLTQIDSQ